MAEEEREMEEAERKCLWPGWETVRLIGSGSFGAVYEINRTLPNGKVEKAALKVISIPAGQNLGPVRAPSTSAIPIWMPPSRKHWRTSQSTNVFFQYAKAENK